MTRSAFVKVCYATFSLERSPHKSHDLLNHRAAVNMKHRNARPGHHRDEHRDIQVEKPKDEGDKQHTDVSTEHPRDVETERHGDMPTEHHRDEHRDILAEKPRVIEDEQHRDVPAEQQRDEDRDIHVGDEQHRDVPTEHHRVFINSVHREVHTQLTTFLTNDLSATWQPYVVEYYSQLTTLCLSRGLASDEEDFIPLLSLCLGSNLYDVRLSALRFIVGVLAGSSGAMKDDDDDDGDIGVFPLDFPAGRPSAAAAGIRDLLLSKLVSPMSSGDSRGLYQLIVDMLLHSESQDECLVMVSC